ncbi:MAG: hypothetical protein ACREOZ_03260 [Gloeomargaritales cyanobacterium]
MPYACLRFYSAGDRAFHWIQTWFFYIETEAEFEVSKDKLFSWLAEESKGDFETGSKAIKEWILTSILPKKELWVRYLRKDIRAMDEVSTSLCESQNSSNKRGPMAVNPSMSIATSAKVMTDYAVIRQNYKLQSSASVMQSHNIWSRSPIADVLSPYAEGIVAQNYDSRNAYVSVQGELLPTATHSSFSHALL